MTPMSERGLHSRRVKVLVGPRGSGKGELLRTVCDEFRATGLEAERIVFLDLAGPDGARFKTADDVLAFLRESRTGLPRQIFLNDIDRVECPERLLQGLVQLGDMSNVAVTLTSEAPLARVDAMTREYGLFVHRVWTKGSQQG